MESDEGKVKVMRCAVVALGVSLLLSGCGDDQVGAAGSDAPNAPLTSPSSTASAVMPQPSASASVSATPSPATSEQTAEPLTTTVPVEVMLTPDRQQTEDNTRVEDWRGGFCLPDAKKPTTASAMRTRRWRGPTNPDTGPLEYTQQVAAFPSVQAAVAEADKLVTAAESCPESRGPAGPKVTELPLGTQGRLVVFAEGGDYSIRGFFRRANAVVSVQGRGDLDREVRDALNESFERVCLYERPRAC